MFYIAHNSDDSGWTLSGEIEKLQDAMVSYENLAELYGSQNVMLVSKVSTRRTCFARLTFPDNWTEYLRKESRFCHPLPEKVDRKDS